MITLKQLKDKLHKDFGWENLESDDNKWFVDNLLKDTIQAIEVIHCCKSDSELLRDKKEPTTWDAFLAGYKKRAEMSGLKYDEVSELHAKTLYKCWSSFDLNP